MRKFPGVIVLLGIFIATQSLHSVTFAQTKKVEQKHKNNTNEIIAGIKKYREEGERKLVENKFTRKEVSLTGNTIKETIKQKWEKMDLYYDGAKLVRIQLYPHHATSGRTEEFYLMDNKLVFAFIQDKGPKHEGKDMGEPGKEFYFHKDKLIKFEDRSGDPPAMHTAQEKKMYESRLPFEIVELLEIINKK